MRTQTRIVEDIQQSYTFPQWLDSYQSKATQAAYHSGVGSFLRSIYQTDEPVEQLAERYIKETKRGKRDIRKDLLDYIGFTQKGQAYTSKVKAGKAMPPMSLHLCLAATKNFLSYRCNIDISNKVILEEEGLT